MDNILSPHYIVVSVPRPGLKKGLVDARQQCVRPSYLSRRLFASSVLGLQADGNVRKSCWQFASPSAVENALHVILIWKLRLHARVSTLHLKNISTNPTANSYSTASPRST